MKAYIVKYGVSGDGYSIKGVYTDYQLARKLCDKLIENHYCKMQYEGYDYWSGECSDSGSYICITRFELDKEVV